MADLRTECERCLAPLPAVSTQATWCAHGCTFCATCNGTDLKGTCPNCGGELLPRPRLDRAPDGVRLLLDLDREAAECLVRDLDRTASSDLVEDLRDEVRDFLRRGAGES